MLVNMIGSIDLVENPLGRRKAFWRHTLFEVAMIDASECEMIWRTAKDCDGGQCVEIGVLGGIVMIRDSANRDGGRVELNQQQWRMFVTAIKDER